MNKEINKKITGTEFISDMRTHFNKLEELRIAKKPYNTTYQEIKEHYEEEQRNK